MDTSTAEETGNAQATATCGKPQATKKARVRPQRAHVAPKTGRPTKKATRAEKAPKAKKTAKVREGSKTDQVLELLKRPGGVNARELMKVTGWQPHSVRGFLSGTIGKKMGFTLTSAKGEDGERTYSIKI
jgi:Protein of unknown function (DUF3489)